MRPLQEFQNKPAEFWALVKLVSQELGYSQRQKRGQPPKIKRYELADVQKALAERGLVADSEAMGSLVAYADARANLLEDEIEPRLMDRAEAEALFKQIRKRVDPPEHLLPMNKQKGDKRHYAYLTGIVNMLTYEALAESSGVAGDHFDSDPRGPLTIAVDGKPLRTLFRWMDGAYPSINEPHATWEIKEYYGTTTFGSRVADGVYETALDGYELLDLQDAGVSVDHFLMLDDYFTWWICGRSYLCRIVDMLHVGLLDEAFFGREVEGAWPAIVAAWPPPATTK